MHASDSNRSRLAGLTLAALGVVYGDIGTSPLYALKECFSKEHGVDPTRDNVLGVLSLILWSLILIVSIKYILFVMRADNKGEGGILALMALAFPEARTGQLSGRLCTVMVGMGLFGSALLYGDGMITPAVSVLGAVEGLDVATPKLGPFVVGISVAILIGLFSCQSAGTGTVGRIFGPVMMMWFAAISLMGLSAIVQEPSVLGAINPFHGFQFLRHGGWVGFVVLGSVFLAVTGGEALYADMGHFGARPIRLAWFIVVLPSLMLNYFGQGANLILHPESSVNPFYKLAPTWALYPLVGLATAAAVIASQALISGAFSLSMQAIQLGYLPRLQIDHTSERERGQIYMPQVNWTLMVASVALVLGFQTSSNLAAAYGIAVTLTMMATTVLFYFVTHRLWNWSLWQSIAVSGSAILIEGAFFSANAIKVLHGGWFPLLIGAILFTLMTTWKTGRRLLWNRIRDAALPVEQFLGSLDRREPMRVKGTAIYLAGNSDGTPIALLHNLKHNKVLHERVVFLTILVADDPRVKREDRVQIEEMRHGFWRVRACFGFMEEPNVPEVLRLCEGLGLTFKEHETTYFLSRETIIPVKRSGMMLWRERLFALMSRNAQSATTFFRLPAGRVVELGMQVEL